MAGDICSCTELAGVLIKTNMQEEQVNHKVKDPVCGMDVDPARARSSYEYEGRKYFFCNPRCLEKFRVDAQKYLTRPAPVMAMHSHGASQMVGITQSSPNPVPTPLPDPSGGTESGPQDYTC